MAGWAFAAPVSCSEVECRHCEEYCCKHERVHDGLSGGRGRYQQWGCCAASVLVWPPEGWTVEDIVGDRYCWSDVPGGYSAWEVELYCYWLGYSDVGDIHAEGWGDEVLAVDSAVLVVVAEEHVDASYSDERSLIVVEGYRGFTRVSRIVARLVQGKVGGWYCVCER